MSDAIILLSNVRLSFPHLIEPQVNINKDTGVKRSVYSADFIMPPDHSGFAQFMTRVGELAVAKWTDHANNVLQMINQTRKQRNYGQGSEKVNQTTFKVYDGYEGMIYISANNKVPPQVIQADGKPVDPTNTLAYQQLTRQMYGGCRVNAAIKPWVQDNKPENGGKGIRCELIAIQFAGDDTPFGEGTPDASGMFGATKVADMGSALSTGQAGNGMPPPMFGQTAAGMPPFFNKG